MQDVRGPRLVDPGRVQRRTSAANGSTTALAYRGVVRASIGDIPLSKRPYTVRQCTAAGRSRIHCPRHLVIPLYVTMMALLLLLSCCSRVAHRQFPGAYGPSWSGYRSNVVPAGRGPMSARKFANVRHLSHTAMPLPP